MGERCNRTAEVRGSIPLSSTTEGRLPGREAPFVVDVVPPIAGRTAARSGRLCDMEHRMSDDELRRAIRVLRERADSARSEGRDADADGIEETIRKYQEEMAQRL